jgi:2-amino-4-hydroxy-6-hydroxymethyldihydropteridine diphosphokinase
LSVAYVGLGSNLNDKINNLDRAIDLVGRSPGTRVLRKSSIYQTEPVGVKEQPDFLNMVLEIDTALSPFELLDFLQGVEQTMARKKEIRWGPRNIDLDLLLYEDEVIDSERLILPHPGMHLRKFVLVPLAEIARDKIHPVFKKTIVNLLEDLKENSKVELLKR